MFDQLSMIIIFIYFLVEKKKYHKKDSLSISVQNNLKSSFKFKSELTNIFVINRTY